MAVKKFRGQRNSVQFAYVGVNSINMFPEKSVNVEFFSSQFRYFALAEFGVQPIVFMIFSFVIREPEMRRQAFMVVALLVGKLLFFDLANKGTLERIVSFIGAGMTLILSSYVYALGVNAFKRKVNLDDFAAQPESANPDDLSERAEESPLYPETA